MSPVSRPRSADSSTGFKFISEKVSHHPPVMAFHASSELDTEIVPAWEINGHIAPSQKFWGRSFELMFPGNFSVTFADTGETFSVIKPSSFVYVLPLRWNGTDFGVQTKSRRRNQVSRDRRRDDYYLLPHSNARRDQLQGGLLLGWEWIA